LLRRRIRINAASRRINIHSLRRLLRQRSHPTAQRAQRRANQSRHLCGFCGAVLERDAANGVISLDDEGCAGRF
jgi:hypothetical protein